VVTVIALFIPFCISLVAIELLPVAIVCVLLPILFLITLLVAVQSTRFFVDARRSNTLELVLCTPLKIQEIIEGQFLAIQHIFLGPVALVTLLQLAGLSLVFSMGYGPYFTTAAVFPGVFFVLVPGFFVLHLAAVAWAGMWMAATLDKPQNAIRLTVMFIVVMQVLRHVWCLPIFPVDILIIIIARERLHRALRPRASIGPPAMPPVTLPPVLRPPGVPPVLPR
jgi:ABC-type Na+ efflux pump permease subunit